MTIQNEPPVLGSNGPPRERAIFNKKQANGAPNNTKLGHEKHEKHKKNSIQDLQVNYPEVVSECIHELIRRQALERPGAPAICSGEQNWSFEELEEKTTYLGRHLKSPGLGPEHIVPFCFDKSPWTAVAILATLKAGTAFAALDPAHPRSRLEGIVRDTQAKVIIAQPEYVSLFEEMTEHVASLSLQLWQSRKPVVEKSSASAKPVADTTSQVMRPISSPLTLHMSLSPLEVRASPKEFSLIIKQVAQVHALTESLLVSTIPHVLCNSLPTLST